VSPESPSSHPASGGKVVSTLSPAWPFSFFFFLSFFSFFSFLLALICSLLELLHTSAQAQKRPRKVSPGWGILSPSSLVSAFSRLLLDLLLLFDFELDPDSPFARRDDFSEGIKAA
jgi:hypothetical protein